MVAGGVASSGSVVDPVLTSVVNEDKVPRYKMTNLGTLFTLLLATCVEMERTSRFDYQMINTVQMVPIWQACTS